MTKRLIQVEFLIAYDDTEIVPMFPTIDTPDGPYLLDGDIALGCESGILSDLLDLLTSAGYAIRSCGSRPIKDADHG